VRASGTALTAGIESHQIEGRQVAIYSIEKTIADCFKYRNKIGLDVALEALKEAWVGRRMNVDALWRYSDICRVTNVIRPYVEAIQV
jgi:predicted transcriptional regulator of viral defense system